MPLGLFACRHAAAAATDSGRWTPVLRLGGSRSLSSIARAAARACRSSGSSKVGRKSACSVGSARVAAAGGLPSSCRGHSSSSESESLELHVAADTASEEEEDRDGDDDEAHCCCRGFAKRAMHVAAESSDASIHGRYGWRDPSSASPACCSGSSGRVSNSSRLRHSVSSSGEEPSLGVWGGRSEDVVRCRFSPNGCFLAACTSSGALRVYEVETGKQVCNIPYAHAGGINDICWHHSSGYIFTASSDGSAALFPLTFRTTGGAARRLLRSSGRMAGGVSSSSGQLPLHVENAVAPLLEFFPRAAAVASTAGTPSAAAGAGKGAGGGAAGSAGSTLSAAAAARHRNISSSSMGGVAVAPVTCVTAPQSSSAASSVHCMYTGSYDEFVRSWDMRASRGPLLQVRAHDGPVTSLDFAEASPLLLPPYVPSRTAFPSQHSLFSLISHNEGSCCCCPTCCSTCRCCCGSCCGCEVASCGSCCCCHSSGAAGVKGGLAFTGAEVAVASAAAALGGSCSRKRPLSSSAAAAAAAVSLPDMLASASVDGLVRLWQAPALKLLRTTRSGRGGWEGGSSGATAASPSAAAATVGSSGSSSVGCGSPAAAAAAATAGCCHVTWSRSGNFLLCLYEQGLGGGTVLRLRTLQQRLERRIPRRQLRQQQQQERQGEGGKRSRLNGEAEGRVVVAGAGEDQNTQKGGEFAEESEEEEEEEEDDIAEEEEKWWGQETCMPLPVPFMWDEIVQQELLESACEASWHPAPPSRHTAAAAAGGAKAATQPRRSGEGEQTANAATPRDVESSRCGSGPPQNGRKRGACVLRTAADTAAAVPCCAQVAEGAAAAAGGAAAPSATWTAPAAWRSDGTAAALYALLCRKEKIFSPFGTFWRDCAVLPGSDGCVRVFDALRGKLLHTLVPAADISSGSGSAVCTSVDAHPDWSVGVLASSCSAPDGAVVLWLWEGDGGEEDD